MQFRRILLAGLLAWPTLAIAAGPYMDISVGVTRSSEYKLNRKQTAVIDEATKLSAACRVFYGLYDRWPSSIAEIEGRTVGIDFSKFNGKASLEAIPEGLVITVFDTKYERKVLAEQGEVAATQMQDLAKDPSFKIRVELKGV